MNNYKKVKVLLGEIKEYAIAKDAEMGQIIAKGRATTEKRDKFTPDNADYRRLDAEVRRLTIEAQALEEDTRKDFQRRSFEMEIQIYREIQMIAEWVAQRHDLTMVVKVVKGQVSSKDINAARQQIIGSILYSDARYDITDEVTSVLNQSYAKNAAAQPPNAAGGPRGATAAAAGRQEGSMSSSRPRRQTRRGLLGIQVDPSRSLRLLSVCIYHA